MKTARELLLERHQSVQPQLDALRHAALDELSRTTSPPRRTRRGMRDRIEAWIASLRPLHGPLPLHGAALGLVCVVAAALNHESIPDSGMPVASRTPTVPRQIVASLREHRRQLEEWIQTPLPPPPPAVPQAGAPGHRRGDRLPSSVA